MSDRSGRKKRGWLDQPRIRLLALGLFLLSPGVAGCGGSKESGTLVEVSEEAKAQIQARRDSYSKKPKKGTPSASKSAGPRR